MSTRSRIGIIREEGRTESIYCHFDGYPEKVGRILRLNYQDEKKVNALMQLGDLSILGPEIGEKQDFDDRGNRNPEWCLAYGRDRGETDVDSIISENKKDFIELSENSNACFVYLYDDAQ